MGERRAIFVYLTVAIALEVVAWLVPAIASTATATALVGYVYNFLFWHLSVRHIPQRCYRCLFSDIVFFQSNIDTVPLSLSHSLAISTFYTAAITTGGKLIPRHLHADAFSLISSIGQLGSAFFPLLVGVLSSQKSIGIWILEPTVLALLVAQGICWWFVPRVEKKVE